MTYRKAAEKHGLSKSSVERQYKRRKIVGRPSALSEVEEELIAQLTDDVAEWGFPIGRFEVKLMVKDLLDRKGVQKFKNNIPGEDWYVNWHKRNRMSERLAASIKVARAGVDKNTVDVFFDKLEDVCKLHNIKPENLYNYDETNFQNNAGKSWVIVRRGRRRVEKVQDDTKQSFSVMWCGSAAGEMLPPTVVYKAKNVYEHWTTDAPAGSTFMSTESGWFDSKSFSLWFTENFLPSVEGKEGPILLLGDNLGSHFNADLVRLAKEKNVYFAMLPPNATHLLQPLDVSVFAPMKRFVEFYKRLMGYVGRFDTCFFCFVEFLHLMFSWDSGE